MTEQPESFEQLVRRGLETAGRVYAVNAEHPEWGLPSAAEPVTGSDPDGLVEVTIAGYQVRRVRIDHLWFPDAGLEDVERRVVAAANAALVEFFGREVEAQRGLAADGPGLKELQELSAQVTEAFDRFADRMVDRMRAVSGDLEIDRGSWDRAAAVFRDGAAGVRAAGGRMSGFDEGMLCPGGPQTVADIAISVVFGFGARFFADRCGDVADVLGESAEAMAETARVWGQVEDDNVEAAGWIGGGF